MTEGVYLIDRLRHRCVEDGDCLIWQGDVAAGCKAPKYYFKGRRIPLRTAMWEELHGALPAKRRVGMKCGTTRCIEPTHMTLRTRSQELKGIKRTVVTLQRISAARRARSKLTAADCIEIRASNLSQYKLAALYGVSQKSISRVIRHETFQTYSSPWAGLEMRK